MSGFSRLTDGKAAPRRHGARRTRSRRPPCRTPAYVYDLDAIASRGGRDDRRARRSAHTVAYAVKANSAGSIVRTLALAGTGAEVVSRGELEVAPRRGRATDRIMTTAVAKQDHEIDAAITAEIRAIQMESVEEIARVSARARALGKVARLSLRVNPGVSIDSHAHVATGHEDAKFGIALADLGRAWELCDRDPHVRIIGVGAHVGSTLKQVESYLASARVVCQVALARLRSGKTLELVDFGGGFGIDYGAGPLAAPRRVPDGRAPLLAAERARRARSRR